MTCSAGLRAAVKSKQRVCSEGIKACTVLFAAGRLLHISFRRVCVLLSVQRQWCPKFWFSRHWALKLHSHILKYLSTRYTFFSSQRQCALTRWFLIGNAGAWLMATQITLIESLREKKAAFFIGWIDLQLVIKFLSVSSRAHFIQFNYFRLWLYVWKVNFTDFFNGDYKWLLFKVIQTRNPSMPSQLHKYIRLILM